MKNQTALPFILWVTCLSICSGYAFSQPADEKIHYLNLFGKTSSGVSCYRIPALITAPNGDLVAAIDERVPSCADLKGNRDINIVIRRSHDQGKTWLAIQKVVDYPPGQSASDPSMIVDKVTGEILLFFNYMDLDKEKDVYHFKITVSKDNGISWSDAAEITTQISKPEWRQDFQFITSGNGIQTSSGRLLHTLVNLDKGLFLFGSDDHGKSWSLIGNPVKPADESRVVELENGSLLINSRVNGAGMRIIHTSSDQGRTWTSVPDSSLADPGCNAGLVRYSSVNIGSGKSRLLFSNANSTNKRENMTVRISYDEGKTWSSGKCIYAGSAAYSALSVLDNGAIALLFEKDNYQEIAFACFTLEWLTDGKDSIK